MIEDPHMEYVHPILPPKNLLSEWEGEWFSGQENLDVLLITAYQAGADHELDECCGWLISRALASTVQGLRLHRRPLSLKKQALAAIDKAIADKSLSTDVGEIVKKALDLIKED